MALIAHWKLDDIAGGMVDDTGTLAAGTYFNSPSLGLSGIDGTAVGFDGVDQYATADAGTQLAGLTNWSLSINMQAGVPIAPNPNVFVWQVDSYQFISVAQLGTGELQVTVASGSFIPGPSLSTVIATTAAVDVTAWSMLTVTGDNATNTLRLYVNGALAGSSQSGNTIDPTGLAAGTGEYNLATNGGHGQFNAIELDDIRVYSHTLDASEVSAIWFGSPPPAAASVLSMSLQGFLSASGSNIPMRLAGLRLEPAADLPVRLESANPADFTGPTLTWSVTVLLDNVDISDQISGDIDIGNTEGASALASIVIRPPAGPVDLNDYERKSLIITFNELDSAGAFVSSHRRYTGTTSSANFDPDDALINIDATTNVQGQLENMPRVAIDTLTPDAIYSPNVFDDTADGYQYCKDRLSTTASEIHSNVWGSLVVTEWAAKVVPDLTFTDGERFGNSLTLTRANLRDLISRVTVNMDFRFVRLRHREIQTFFMNERGFCDYLNNNWVLPQKDMVRSAADGTEWTRTSSILFDELPAANPSVCNPPRAWAGGADEFCLGASWFAARRWAQTITEEYSLELIATDLEEAIGIQGINADYGVEAIYDATDYEANKDFDAPPVGSTFSSLTNDWQLDADDTEVNGRADMDLAQQVAMSAAKSEILGRARKNRVNVANVYQPLLQLAHTVRVDTPSLVAQGKVYGYNETLNPVSGELNMTIEIAISRHDGSGLATDTPVDPAPVPLQPQEVDTGRMYYIGYHVGAEEFSPADDDDWDGYMTNVGTNGDSYFPTGEVYRTRFVVAYPEIEEVARDSLEQPETTPYEVEIPQDELTLSI